MTKQRFQQAGNYFHIISRGIEKRFIFHEDVDYNFFLQNLEKLIEKLSIKLFAYCFMSNHFHLLILLQNNNMSTLMQHLLSTYAMYFNSKYERVGHLFQGRYQSILVRDEIYLIELTRYIHLNPYRAGIIDSPFSKYEWSSMKYYLDLSKKTNILSRDLISEYFPAKGDYKNFVLTSPGLAQGSR